MQIPTDPSVMKPPGDEPRCFSHREPLSAYLERLDYVSSSVLRRFARTGVAPATPTSVPPVPKEATLGDALHALLLEPERMEQEFIGADAGVPAPSGLSEQDALARTWLSARECSALRTMRDAVLRYPRAPLAQWLKAGEKELSIYWTDAAEGRWKARPDCFAGDVIVELKTASDPRASRFGKSRRHFGYDLQAAHYVEAVSRLTGVTPRFVYVAVESVHPHTVWVYEMSADELRQSRDALEALKTRFHEARAAAVREAAAPPGT